MISCIDTYDNPYDLYPNKKNRSRNFPMKHPENEFSQNHSLKRLSCSAVSGNNLNNVIGIETIKI